MPEAATITPALTFRDRVAIGSVRAIGKPALTLFGDARIIRGLTNLTRKQNR